MKKDKLTLTRRMERLEDRFDSLILHFTNHLHNRTEEKILSCDYMLVVIVMFCFLKWGIK